MSERPIRSGPPREIPPLDMDTEAREVNAFFVLEAEKDAITSKKLTNRVLRGLGMDPATGDTLWTLSSGLVVRGAAGRHAMVEEVLQQELVNAAGGDPYPGAIAQLIRLGLTADQAEHHLPRYRLRREEDGNVHYNRAEGRSPRDGGSEVILEAVKDAYSAWKQQKDFNAPADLEADAQGRHSFRI